MPSLTFFVPTNRRNKNGGPAPLDGLNELVNAERISTHVGNSLKRRNGLNAQASCLYAMKEQGWECPKCKCRVTLTFHEPSTRRDPDKEYLTTVWLPKSQIEVYHQFTSGDKSTIWKVPLWLMNKNHLPAITKKIADQVKGSAA